MNVTVIVCIAAALLVVAGISILVAVNIAVSRSEKHNPTLAVVLFRAVRRQPKLLVLSFKALRNEPKLPLLFLRAVKEQPDLLVLVIRAMRVRRNRPKRRLARAR